jgi:DMSO/TMAO reductase YedYZ molybdopterin-dependent catalytic subunit
MTLPPGQRLLDRFPRFGENLTQPAPSVPADPVLEIRGAVTAPFAVPLTALADLPRRELTADFHCVAGWSAAGLRWEGVAFRTAYAALVEPALRPGATITHLVFRGLDGFRAVMMIEDALGEDVLLADHLDGRPLDGDHGAPLRLVSPTQYGYVNTKHLSRIEVHTAEPPRHDRSVLGGGLSMRLLSSHPRARVRFEERPRPQPPWLVRPVYRATVPYLLRLSAKGTPGSGAASG